MIPSVTWAIHQHHTCKFPLAIGGDIFRHALLLGDVSTQLWASLQYQVSVYAVAVSVEGDFIGNEGEGVSLFPLQPWILRPGLLQHKNPLAPLGQESSNLPTCSTKASLDPCSVHRWG